MSVQTMPAGATDGIVLQAEGAVMENTYQRVPFYKALDDKVHKIRICTMRIFRELIE